MQRSATIAFGESLDTTCWRGRWRRARECDLFLAIGTSLTVQPAASLCGYAQRRFRVDDGRDPEIYDVWPYRSSRG